MYVLELSFRMSRIVFEAKPPKPYLTATSQKKKNLTWLHVDPNSCRPSREFLFSVDVWNPAATTEKIPSSFESQRSSWSLTFPSFWRSLDINSTSNSCFRSTIASITLPEMGRGDVFFHFPTWSFLVGKKLISSCVTKNNPSIQRHYVFWTKIRKLGDQKKSNFW